MSLKYSFAGKRILVTGGGQALQGITLSYRNSADLADWDATRKAIQSFGVLDHVVNNAAMAKPQKLLDITKESAKLQFDVNFFACINVAQTVARKMIDVGSGGTFVNGCKGAVPFTSMYCASKAALEMLTKSTLWSWRVTRNVIKRAIDSNEVADLVMFLLSPLSAMITGETVVVDGGALASIM
ncbi:L-xylulose reductase [Orchesella cincta]|uniref:L-xylulose reductase n=1 Tax=Orchesella cincta TaxID=48709 RepID=A0A1D2M1V6_ORCCI|nr:L-xylulose reductase [Orchesella cincta]